MITSGRRVALTLAFLFGVVPPAGAAPDIPFPDHRPPCAAQPVLTVADFSFSLNGVRSDKGDPTLQALKAFGVTTIFRYYDQKKETLPGKTLLPVEADTIIAAGLKIGVVFQHHNDDPAKFLDPRSGPADAERALALADDNRQPFGSAIYFGVDGPEYHLSPLTKEFQHNSGQPMSEARKRELRQLKRAYMIESYDNFLTFGPAAFGTKQLDRVTPDMMRPVIAAYFEAIRKTFDAYAGAHAGRTFVIGMYCTPGMCIHGAEKKLADLFWLSPEGRGDPEYRQFLKRTADWRLVQQLPTRCAGWGPTPDGRVLEFDFSYVNPDHADFGAWSAKRP